jgi:anti-sigma regulatory factor (Ser/Thr protein kinase)
LVRVRATIRVTVQLDPVGGAVRDARRVVESALSGWQDDAAAQVAVLLTSEVVTNAIVHASPHANDGRVGLTVDSDDELARIEVTDGYAVLPVVRGLRVGRTSGRGVMLLDLLAARWGITRGVEGKTVWFEVSRH